MNVNQDKLQDFIKDLNKIFEELVKTPEDQEKVNVVKIKHDELLCGFNIARMNIGLTRIQNQQRRGRNDKEKLMEAVSKPIKMNEEASENNMEDANPIESIKCYLHRLDGVTSIKLCYGCQLGNLLEKCFLQGRNTYKNALIKCKIKIKWTSFYEDYTNFATFTEKLITTTLSLRFIRRNYAVIKQICDSNQDIFT